MPPGPCSVSTAVCDGLTDDWARGLTGIAPAMARTPIVICTKIRIRPPHFTGVYQVVYAVEPCQQASVRSHEVVLSARGSLLTPYKNILLRYGQGRSCVRIHVSL